MAADRPNFLFIQADQMAGPALPFGGNKTVKAPHMSRLAEEGVVFANCYCNFPMCGPSRASMHAGRLPYNIGMYDNASEFRSAVPTFAHYLRNEGYRVEMSGKMHFVGADQLHGYHRRHTTEIYPANFAWTVDWSKGREYRPTNLTMAPVLESGPAIRTLQMDYDDEVAFCGMQAIYDLARKRDDRPWFLTVSFTEPHSPYVIDQEYWDRYRHDDIEYPAVDEISLNEMDHLSRNLHYCQGRHQFTVAPEDRRIARHGYYGMISYVDDKVALLRKTIEKCGLQDNTIIVLTADHGDMMGERGMWYKQHFFEWAAKVPLLFHAPGRFAPSRVDRNVSLVDLMPTFMELASGKSFDDYADGQSDGNSLVPALDGDQEKIGDVAISEFSADGSTGVSKMVKKGPWKYMYLEGVEELLYNLESDPLELDNKINDPESADTGVELREIAMDCWDPEQLHETIKLDQRRRLLIHKATGGEPTWVNVIRHDDNERYIRNAGAADTKALARFPYVEPVKQDKV